MPEAPRSRTSWRRTAENGANGRPDAPSSRQPPAITRAPLVAARVANSLISLDFPTPASPPMSRAAGEPCCTAASAASSAASCSYRPTSTGLTLQVATSSSVPVLVETLGPALSAPWPFDSFDMSELVPGRVSGRLSRVRRNRIGRSARRPAPVPLSCAVRLPCEAYQRCAAQRPRPLQAAGQAPGQRTRTPCLLCGGTDVASACRHWLAWQCAVPGGVLLPGAFDFACLPRSPGRSTRASFLLIRTPRGSSPLRFAVRRGSANRKHSLFLHRLRL